MYALGAQQAGGGGCVVATSQPGWPAAGAGAGLGEGTVGPGQGWERAGGRRREECRPASGPRAALEGCPLARSLLPRKSLLGGTLKFGGRRPPWDVWGPWAALGGPGPQRLAAVAGVAGRSRALASPGGWAKVGSPATVRLWHCGH